MAGPTPVSALIHAATMVTAGVYLVVRSAPLFELSGVALTVVLIVGLLTMLFAGTCALAQDDIKRVLAYSTISQLGFMFMAAGMRFYTGAMFMLVAHAFYKALMFLGAGLRDARDARRDRPPTDGRAHPPDAGHGLDVPPRRVRAGRGLRRSPASSRRTRSSRSRTAPAGRGSTCWGRSARSCPRCTSGVSCSWRSSGRPRSEEAEHAHESPVVMTVPLVVLAAGTILAGLAPIDERRGDARDVRSSRWSGRCRPTKAACRRPPSS